MRLNDAVHVVTGEVFRDGWSRVRGSMQGLHVAKQTQLTRAAAGHRPAVFKAIRGGGTHTKSQLANQLDYLTTKSTHIVDSSGFLDGKAKLEAGDIKDLTERFAKRWDAGFKPKLGQTTHMLMSFPIGTRGEDVRDIATDVAERFFQTGEGHFDYIIAVHEDRDHPHAHLVLNRRSQEGEFFFLGRNHRFNYDDFRLAMVEEAERYGVRLEATRRVDRGVVHYPARTREVYAAKEEGRAPRGRERVGADLARTLAEIANTRTVYHSLAAEASREAREDIAAALFRAGEVLAHGGQVDRTGDVYMAEDQSFEDLRSLYAEKLARVQGMIAEKSDTERPVLEKRLIEIQTQVQHMQPLGLRSSTLSEAPSEGGVYSEANIQESQLERLSEPHLRSRIDAALRGTGISTSEVVARIETGASNAALEHQWIADDLSKVAEARDLNLERRADLEQARDILNDVHVKLGTLLERENVLRRDGVVEAEPVSERFHYHEDAVREMEGTIRQEMRAEGLTAQQIEDRDWEVVSRAERRITAEQRAYLEAHPELLARPADVIDRSEPYRETITDAARASEITREVDRIMAGRDVRTPVADAVADDVSERYPDMPSHLARGLGATYAAVVEIRDTEAINQVRRDNELREGLGVGTRDERLATRDETVPLSDRSDRIADEIARVLDHERAGELSAPFETEAERDAFRTEIARVLDNPQLERLTSGDADALDKVLEDRLDRLYVAKVYLQSDAATANTEALRQVVDDLADAEYEKHRATDVDGETERGQVH
ncbi:MULTISPECIES: relaxase/mobilization nuclease domain-containing protein [unclassified Sulfitobacter]|uniref:relaxase/mobilization nuclease domain-containing protein n=1 Tax=unclassified Sulfitobacter TaxID=196795 RepID=UPI0023E1475E|nr:MULTISPECIES: relaxase/mobilization nuclease domain-containing protein [unclassified Sulfitobacter]MDF3384732.1 relaxase/mobilization nuclease domain-containing protein [Sulfitobacter sp. Ks11]MDF3387951.1 relaxase/mobilization nuclease domain-containing protein [Sulfitobacter sp. M85]MDF3391371.1 relaxase/mobilization nuclease domain-containing protein [Sulfitobacter sp. Ks16]MDF3402208.1 relaxase/mobilization nuclease domain-containing protein [Sulfitobacter sp. KE39]MDF3405430.1 relaxase